MPVSLWTRLRNYFLTGLIIAAPLAITIYLSWWLVSFIDDWGRQIVLPFVPAFYNPEQYVPYTIPGIGIFFSVIFLTLLGFLTANIVGRSLINYGEHLLGRMPLVRNLYSGLKQIFETVLSERSHTFQQVALAEYPRKGLWAIVFVSVPAKGEVQARLGGDERQMVSVFLPTTPNPTSGFLLFVPENDLVLLDMSVEEAAKLVISAGLVTPEYLEKTERLARAAQSGAASDGRALVERG